MIKRRLRIHHALQFGALISLCLFGTASVAMYLDADRLIEAEQRVAKLRWFNIEGAPQWLGGIAPTAAGVGTAHRIKLQPGESTLLQIESPGQLRVRSTQGSRLDGLDFGISNGSGLFQQLRHEPPNNKGDLLLQPATPADAVYRIRNPADNREAIEFSVFRAVYLPAPHIKKAVLMQAPDQEIFRISGGSSADQDFFRSDAQDPLSFDLEEVRHDSVRGFSLALRMDLADPMLADARQIVLRVSLDHAPWREFLINSAPERNRLIFLNDAPALTGRTESIHFQVPNAIKSLQIQTSVPAFVQLHEDKQPDFLWKGNQASGPGAGQKKPNESGALSTQSKQINENSPMGREVASNRADWVAQLFRSSRDQRYRGNGMASISALTQAAAGRPDIASLGQALTRLNSDASFWRALYPRVSGGALESRPVRVSIPGYGVNSAESPRFWIHPAQVAGELGRALVGVLSRGVDGETLEYFLQPRQQPSSLLLAIPREQTGRLQVQFDEQTPIELESDPVADAGRAIGALSRSEARALLAAELDPGAPIAVHGVDAAVHAERPAVNVRTVQIQLPADVSRVRILSDGLTDVAAWVRTSRKFSLDESSYLYYLDAAGGQKQTARIFFDALKQSLACSMEQLADPVQCWPDQLYLPEVHPAPGPEHAARMLRNDWLPLFRLLRSRLELFRGEQPANLALDGGRSMHSGSLAKARRLMKARKWLPALEEWSLVAASGHRTRAVQGKLGQVRALQQLGEMRTTEQMLKQWMLHSNEPGLQQEALRMLETRYAQAASMKKLTGLHVASLLDGISPAEVDKLVRSLLAEGFGTLAIRAHLAANIESAGDELYATLFRERWLKTLDRLLAREPAPTQHRWHALRNLTQGNLPAAFDLFETAGTEGDDWVAAIRQAQLIRQRLRSDDSAERSQAIADWQTWWLEHPGARHFTGYESGIRSSAGSETVTVPARDLSLSSWRASARFPVEISVAGPTTMRIAVRPLHPVTPSGMYAAKSGVLNFELEGGAARKAAFAGNRPSASIKLLSSNELAGTEIQREISVPEGIHQLRVWPDDGIALVRVEQQQPVIPLGILPQPDPVRQAWIQEYGWPKPPEAPLQTENKGPLSILLPDLREGLKQLLRRNTAGQNWIESPDQQQMTGRNLIAVGGLAHVGKGLPAWAQIRQAMGHKRPASRVMSASKGLAALRGGSMGPISQLNPLKSSQVARDLNQQLEQGRYIDAQPLETVDTEAGRGLTAQDRERDRLIEAFRKTAEMDSARLAGLMLAAERYPDDPDIQSLLSVVRNQGAGWRAVTSFAQSAGIRKLQYQGWSPETPSLRVRRALIGNRWVSGDVLGGAQALTLVMHNLDSTRIRVSLRDIPLFSATPEPVSIDLLLDHQPVGSLQVRPDGVSRRTLQIPAGDHELRVESRAPTFGQTVHLVIEEYRPEENRWVMISPKRSRTYQVATRDEPVVYQAPGPVWARIDEYRDGVVSPTYRFLDGTRERLVLAPRGAADTAYFRIFEYVPKPRPIRLEKLKQTSVSVAHAPAAIADPVPMVRQPRFHDRLALGRQEDGTPAVYSRYALRRIADPDGIGGNQRDHALDLGVRYHQRIGNGEQTSYYSSAIFVRESDSIDPLLGLKSRLDRYQTGSPWSVGGQVSLLVQNLDRVDGIAWGAQLRGHLSHRHAYSDQTRQTITVQPFIRGLGLSTSEAGRSDPDPELFSDYKRDHRYGAIVDWSGRHELFADTLLRVRSTLQTNEDFNFLAPDRIDFSVGMDQKFGPFDIGVAYRSRFFLNDGDRSESVTRNRFTLFGDWSRWSHSGNRINLRLEAARDMERALWTANATLAWNFGAGRDYSDFRPGQVRFRTLREWDMPQTWNPSIDE